MSRRDAILQYIARYREQHGYPPTVREIGEAVGLKSTSSVAYYLRDLEKRGQLRRVPDVSRGIGMAPADPSIRTVPVLGRIAAGLPRWADAVEEEPIALPAHWPPGRVDFALRVRGDSMVGAGILDGDVALVRAQPTADDGDIVVALLDGEATLKRLSRSAGVVRLVAANPAYPPLRADEVRILGRVVGLLRTLP
ncbi:MAG: transcriptional repressor LexA [Actinomycetia bacterium]|nr:transcriptional repressor LexA [Actinomycetes bacterium]